MNRHPLLPVTLLGLGLLLAGCSRSGLSSSPGGQGGLLEGTYGCAIYSWTTDAWGGIYPLITLVDELTILPGGPYSTTLGGGAGTYGYDPATRRISYASIYAEHYAGGTYTPASEETDGDEHIENALIGDEETTIDCYM